MVHDTSAVVALGKSVLRRLIPAAGTPARVILALLLWADLLFVGLHIVYLTKPIGNIPYEWLSVSTDRGYAEQFQYIKEYWIASLLLWLAFRDRQPHFAAWSLLFFYLLCDDSMQVHERMGVRIGNLLELPPILGLRPLDLGELITTGVVLLLLLCPIVVTGLRAPEHVLRSASPLIVVLLGVGVFGVVVDMLHQMLSASGALYAWAGSIEDIGEMLVMSFGLAYAFSLVNERYCKVKKAHTSEQPACAIE